MAIEVFTEASAGFDEVSEKMRKGKFDYEELSSSYNKAKMNTIFKFLYPTASIANFRKVLRNWGLASEDFTARMLDASDKAKCSILLQKQSAKKMKKHKHG